MMTRVPSFFIRICIKKFKIPLVRKATYCISDCTCYFDLKAVKGTNSSINRQTSPAFYIPTTANNPVFQLIRYTVFLLFFFLSWSRIEQEMNRKWLIINQPKTWIAPWQEHADHVHACCGGNAQCAYCITVHVTRSHVAGKRRTQIREKQV